MKVERRDWGAIALLVLGVWAIYGQTGDFGCLSYDDEGYTVNCPFVTGGLTFENVGMAFKDLAWGGIWMPLTNITYMATISLFGKGFGAQHLVSVLFHSINAALFFLLLVRLSKGRATLSFIFAALWALHPLRVESVAWIASRKDTVFTMFTLLGLLAWQARRWGWGTAAMAAACLSKPTAMCFPFLAFAVEFFNEDGGGGRARSRALSTLALRYAPLFVLAAATGGLAMYSQTHATGEATHELFYSTFGWRILNAAVSLGLYLYHLVVPVGLHFWYRPIRGGIPLDAATGLVTLAVTTVLFAFAVWRCRKARRHILLAALWFLAAIGPTLGVAGSFGNHALADRFTYVPMMAFSILAVLAFPRIGRKWAYAVLVIVASVYGVVSFRYAATYRNNLTAFSKVAADDPGHAYAWTNIGSELILKEGDPNVGIPYFRKSLALFPTDEARDELAFALIARKNQADFEEIERLCADVIADPTKDEKGFKLEALGMIDIARRDWARAIACLERAVKQSGENVREDCLMRLAMCHWNIKQYAAAAPYLMRLSASQRPDISAKAKELLSMMPPAMGPAAK